MAFEKGKSGNPAGSKKVRVIAQQLTSILNEVYESGDKSNLRAILDKLVAMAAAGDMQAINAVMDRVDGKPAQTIDANINDDRDLRDLSGAELDDRIRDALRRVEEAASRAPRQAASEDGSSDIRKLN